MIECIFTVDYELYGNGEGSLEELVYEPSKKLHAIFRKWNAPFVLFVEVAELDMIEAAGTDRAIDLIKRQIKDFYSEGFEIGLHLHPQWYNARHEKGRWYLDYNEYNLCTLPRERIAQIVDRSIAYLRNILSQPNFTPLSYRAGNWLLQPSKTVVNVLADRGIKIDSSVFKGGLQRKHGLDYRRALRNGYYWWFADHADVSESDGSMLEFPIYSQMVPIWKMITTKRVKLKQSTFSSAQTGKEKLFRVMDFLRFKYPLKLDFCRMTIDELMRMMDIIIREEQENPSLFRPIVVIGHTKDLVDTNTIELFLSYLGREKITISTFKDVYRRCK